MKTYEELLGAEGRRVYYRAERFLAQDLFTRKRPAVLLGGNRFALDDISMTGLSASGREGEGILEGESDEISILFEGDNEPLFHSVGEVRRVESKGPGTRVALSFKGAPLDISDLVSRYNESLVKRDLNGGLHHALESVSPEYRRHCVDVLHLLRRYKKTLERFEAADGAKKNERESVLYELCEQRLLPEWRDLWRAGNDLVRPLMDSDDHMRSAKEFTEYVLTPEFMDGPIWNRSYNKPLGYPGDFEVMNAVYRWRPRGNTVYERLVDRIGLDVAECIATRMVMVQQAISDTVASKPASAGPARVLSLGCGPAQEIQNYLDLSALPRPAHITLVDQDQDALSHAYQSAYPKMMNKGDGSELRCLQVSFVELMKIGRIFRSIEPQDLIYTVGLVDYLCMRRVQDLALTLYEKLAEGGTLIIGNMADVDLGNQWPMEFICDWDLYYRNEAQMLEFAAHLPPDADKRVVPDPTGRVYMLHLTKP